MTHGINNPSLSVEQRNLLGVPDDPTDAVIWAIEVSQPTGYGQRHGCLFTFARALKVIPKLRDRDTDALLPAFDVWFERALPNIRTKSRKVSWNRLRDAWRDVRVPHGAALAGVMEAVEGDGIARLESLCSKLGSNGKQFFLGCRTAGRVCGVSHNTAWKWLRRLCRKGVLERVRKGSRASRRASEYQFNGVKL